MPTDVRLSPRHRRTILEQLSRDDLGAICDRLGINVEDRRSKDAHLEAIVRTRKVDYAAILGDMKREDLQALCDTLGLDRSGREKAGLVERILSVGTAASATGRGTRTLAEGESTIDYRHDDTRKNNPPAGLADLDKPPAKPTKEYAYDPHLDPQLQWAGKAERASFDVDTVSLHIHERVSTQAILRVAKREDVQRSLFGDVGLSESKAIEFYQHEVGWANRMVLGDSLVVMNSLLEREQLAGKVQCIYMDPPYGVKFNSNFQPTISRRDVKDADDASLTREPEQIQAYRDTWTLGVHSYLTYMRDRLLVARELLHESGSVFVQISDENVHHVRELLDEVFGAHNFVSQIAFVKTSTQTSNFIASTADYLLWYGRNREQTKFREVFAPKLVGGRAGGQYAWLEQADGTRRRMTQEELNGNAPVPGRVFRPDNFTSARQGRVYGSSGVFPIAVDGREFMPGGGQSWKTNEEGAKRLVACNRVMPIGNTLCYVRYLEDFPVSTYSNVWDDTGSSGFGDPRIYVVQTNTRVIGRCVLMTTDPGDLVLDPTCGSGTTAHVAEQWGRRWITCDTSRVALALARQRILTSKFPYYRLRSPRVRDGFVYETVPHITLKSMSQNSRLDGCTTRDEREHLIRDSAEHETLYDQPEEDKTKIRVSGPFTVEAIPVAVLDEGEEHAPLSADARTDDIARSGRGVRVEDPGGDYVEMMLDLLKKTGVQFKAGRHLGLPTLRPVKGPYEHLHAESETDAVGDPRRVAVSLGSKHAPVTPRQVLQGIQETRGYDIVLFVGFACDPEARRMIDAGVQGRELQFVHAAPDILVSDLLKTTKTTKIFTVFGAPDVKVHREKDGQVSVELAAVDIYDPTTGETRSSPGEDVAAWFVDHDYDGKTFCVCQALFPGRKTANPWEKLQKALKGTIDEDKFEALRSTRSLPFKPGTKVCVRVIDDRGNEVMKIADPSAKSGKA